MGKLSRAWRGFKLSAVVHQKKRILGVFALVPGARKLLDEAKQLLYCDPEFDRQKCHLFIINFEKLAVNRID